MKRNKRAEAVQINPQERPDLPLDATWTAMRNLSLGEIIEVEIVRHSVRGRRRRARSVSWRRG